MATTDNPPVDMTLAERIVETMGGLDSDGVIPFLQQVQDAYGYLPKDVLLEMSRRTGVAASTMYGVATFYEQFKLKPRGKHLIRCCRGTACHVRGGPSIAHAVSQVLGVPEGDTTKDRLFTFETVACLGTCFLAPVMMVDNDYYGHLTPGKIEKILKTYT